MSRRRDPAAAWQATLAFLRTHCVYTLSQLPITLTC